jgi:hypothetical protein
MRDVICFMDAVSLMSECADKHVTQNAFYCGYSCNTTVNNVFAYLPDKKFSFVQSIIPEVGLMVH